MKIAITGVAGFLGRHVAHAFAERGVETVQVVREGLPALIATRTCFEYGMHSGELGEELPPRTHNPYGYPRTPCAASSSSCAISFR